MNLDPQAAPHSAADLRRRLKWIEDRLKYLSSSGSYLSNGSITGGTVTINEILTDPASTTGFWNTDTVTTSTTGDVVLRLSHIPTAGSEHVRWNGHPLLRSEWSRTGDTITITDPGYFKVGDVFDCLYAYDTTGVGAVGVLAVAGVTSGNTDNAGSVGVPAGAAIGDTFILVVAGPVAGPATVSSSDPRVTGSITAKANFKVFWGILTSLGPVTFGSTGGSPSSRRGYTLMVLSGARTVGNTGVLLDQTSTPITLPPITFAGNSIGVVFTDIAVGGAATPPSNDTTGAWTEDVTAVEPTTIAGIGVYHLFGATPGTTPPGSIGVATTFDKWHSVTLEVN